MKAQLAIGQVGIGTRAGTRQSHQGLELSERLIAEFDVRCAQGPATVARALSGGNQQKAVLARELDHAPEVLVIAQPTRGLDVGAVEFIHRRIIAERDKGNAILLVSLDLDEIMDLSDRIAVIHGGEIAGTVDAAQASANELGRLMAGAVGRAS